MHIAFVNATRRWGGVKTWTVDLTRHLADQGHAVTVLARDERFLARMSEAGAKALPGRFGMDFHPLSLLWYRNFFREKQIDLAVCNVGKDLRTAGIAARWAGIPVIHRVGLAGDMRDHWKVRLAHRWAAPRILVPCRQIRDGILKRLPHLDPASITVIHTGKRVAPEPPVTVHAPLRLITTSQLNPDKGHADVLDALRALADRGFKFTWDVYGTGSIEDDLKTKAADLGLLGTETTPGPVRFHGFVGDVPARLAEADVFVLPSKSEGLPNTLVEAMAQGLVPVSRDVGGASEVWPEGLPESFLIPRKAGSQAFEQALGHIFAARDNRDAEVLDWKRKTWETCTRDLDIDTQARRIEDYFRETIEQHATRNA